MGFKIIFITFLYFPKCENTKYAVFDYLMLSATRNFPMVPSLFACSCWESSTLHSLSLWRLRGAVVTPGLQASKLACTAWWWDRAIITVGHRLPAHLLWPGTVRHNPQGTGACFRGGPSSLVSRSPAMKVMWVLILKGCHSGPQWYQQNSW